MGRVAFCLALLVGFVLPAALAAVYTGPELASDYITVIDERGVIVFQTGLNVHAGDEFISEDNRLYEVVVVEGGFATARFVRDESPDLADRAIPAQAPAAGPPETALTPLPPPGRQQLIVLYYTHSDESYIPTDGRAAIRGNGGVFKVGAVFAQRLVDLGYAVENNQTRHDPHDANAYQRSRRTFVRLLDHGPAAFFDIHRDSAPPEAYRATVAGGAAAKILLVVGRQNQNRQTTLDYAKTVKAAADAKYRGLIRGIFIAHGNYNQDLHPRALLVEIGAAGNARADAERSAALLADTVPLFLGPAPTGPPSRPPGREAVYGRDILNIVGLALAGAAGFLLLSAGGWREAKRKLARFRKFEFINFFGPRKKRPD